MTRRLLPLALPPQAFIPGQTPRPRDDFFAAIKRGLTAGLTPADLAASAAFEGGLTAFDRRYYWEAHELFEAVWHCLPPASAERHLLRGLIQLANAGLKARMRRPAAVRRIRARAEADLYEAFLHGRMRVMGLGQDNLTALRRQIDEEASPREDAI